ncbi:hypothetical protein MTO96_018660 [Rhipicephalus appendiculatus]
MSVQKLFQAVANAPTARRRFVSASRASLPHNGGEWAEPERRAECGPLSFGVFRWRGKPPRRGFAAAAAIFPSEKSFRARVHGFAGANEREDRQAAAPPSVFSRARGRAEMLAVAFGAVDASCSPRSSISRVVPFSVLKGATIYR